MPKSFILTKLHCFDFFTLVPQLLLKQSDTLHTQYTLDCRFLLTIIVRCVCRGGGGYLISIAYCPCFIIVVIV